MEKIPKNSKLSRRFSLHTQIIFWFWTVIMATSTLWYFFHYEPVGATKQEILFDIIIWNVSLWALASLGIFLLGRQWKNTINKLYHTAETLLQTEQGHRTLLDAIPDLIFVFDRDGRYLDIQGTKHQPLVATENEMIGRTIFDILPKELAQERHALILKALDTGKMQSFEYVIPLSGESRFFEGRIVPSGEDEVLFITRDISDRKETEENLQQLKEFNESIIQRISEGIVVQNLEGYLSFVNPAAAKLLGYTVEELTGQHWTTIVPRDQQKIVERANIRRKAGRADQYELNFFRKDGTKIPTMVSGQPIYEESQLTGTLAVFTDISKQKEAENTLNQINDELEMALLRANELAVSAEQANQSKSEFLANMSHEIRTPMNGIIGMTELTLGTKLTREQREYLTAVQSSAEALLALLNDILDLSKMESGKLELEEINFDLRKIVEQLSDILVQHANEKNLELLLYIHPNIETALRGDPLRIRQIMVNLLGNAIKFTNTGEVALEIEKTGQTESTLELLCTISDTGIGIPEEKLDLIFDSFAQADGSTTRQYGGTGLGLAISKQLVELMHGKIWVESVLGQGSRFKFTMTLSLGDKPTPPITKAPIAGLRILAVDDNATNRRILHDTLRAFGCKPDVAENAVVGLTKIEQSITKGQPFDMVLLDVQMPDMTGLEMLTQIRENKSLSHLPVVMLTSVDGLHTVTHQKDLNWSAYLTKPVKQVDLLNAMMIAMGEASPLDIQNNSETVDAAIKNVPLRILLVDDVEINRRLATIMLERKGFKITCAENGKIALSVLETNDEPFDIVLMDVQMPEMDGLEATAHIRNNPKLAHLPIIAMTAHAMKGDKERFLDAGMDDYVTKPIKSKTVIAAIARQYQRVGGSQLVKAKEPVSQTTEGNEILDPSGPMEWLGDDKEAFAELLRLFLDEVHPLIDKLGEAILNGDADTVDELGHTIKGASANMGALQLQSIASKLEQMGKAKNLTDAPSQLSKLEMAMSRFTAHCQQYL